MKCKDLRYKKTTKKSEKVSSLAYMDDTVWIAANKTSLENMLKIADSFFSLNGIKVNKNKSELVIINPLMPYKYAQTNFREDNTIVRANNKNTSARFLGMWINAEGSQKYVKDLIKKEIIALNNSIRYKKLTDKQILYMFNRVLMPRLEYRLQLMILSRQECKILNSICRKTFKNKIGLSSTAPNSITSNQLIYNLTDM